MGLKSLRTRPGREMGPFYPLSSGPDGGPDKGLKSRPDETRTRNGAFLPTFIRTRWRTGQGVKISSGNPGFERVILPGASNLNQIRLFHLAHWQ